MKAKEYKTLHSILFWMVSISLPIVVTADKVVFYKIPYIFLQCFRYNPLLFLQKTFYRGGLGSFPKRSNSLLNSFQLYNKLWELREGKFD